ncbi:MAG: sulfite exporter TauE/SafE family protein [Candidatus Bathyarchaeota archaeon]|nr:sulfite exporter TauE/SafE family protein [Candidatus Bathyarchaeota archaeon]
MDLIELLFYFASGFAAQLIDGSIGMGYGVTCTALLMSGGVGPALASGIAHISEVGTTAASGVSHFKLGNLRRDIILPLTISGMIGGVIGAALCVFLSAESPIVFTILVSILLEDMGVLILYRFLARKGEQSTSSSYAKQGRNPSEDSIRPQWLSFLGLFASFTDAVGGGGWGPVATPAIILDGVEPRKVVGSINLTEFFVTTVQAATFVILLPTMRWDAAASLLLGGIIAAPFAALICKKLPMRSLGALIGVTLIILSTRNILKAAGLI